MSSNGHNLAQTNGHAPDVQPYIEFRDVCKAFGSNVVLDHVSFDVPPGQTMCILGRSGVGKSVSLQLIMGFLKPDFGEVIVAGEDITKMDEPNLERIRKKVTMVFQNGALFDSLSKRAPFWNTMVTFLRMRSRLGSSAFARRSPWCSRTAPSSTRSR